VELFDQATAKLAALDPLGIALRQILRNPDIWVEIQAAEDGINHLWLEAQGGRMVWPEYQTAVKKWSNLLAAAIKDRAPQTKID
jgi:hypothetical protein